MPDNRRVRMTKRMMKEALLELLEQQPLEKITVKDICDRADVNRSTFYAYYEDANRLLLEIEDDVADQMPVPPQDPAGYGDEAFLTSMEAFYDFVMAHERLFRILILQRDSSSFSLRLVNSVMERYRPPLEGEAGLPPRYAYIFCVNGVIGIMKEWITRGFPISSREFARMALQMCMNATASFTKE